MLADIQIKNLSLKYHQQVLFDQLCFDLLAGEWVTLLGSSGVGKTTLLHFLAGLIDDSDKNTQLTGRIVVPEAFKLSDNVCYMTQNDSLMPWLSALENALIGYRLRGQSVSKSIHEKAKHLFDACGLSKAMDKLPQQLSGGMRQRVALVRTLLENRPVVLMDEPFSAVDAITRVKLQSLAAKLLKGKTVLLVTHDPLEALRLSHKIYVLAGSPAKLGDALILDAEIPRRIDAPDLLDKQSLLLKKLLGNVDED